MKKLFIMLMLSAAMLVACGDNGETSNVINETPANDADNIIDELINDEPHYNEPSDTNYESEWCEMTGGNFDGGPGDIIFRGYYASLGDGHLFVYRAEDVATADFSALHTIDHGLAWEPFDDIGEEMLIGASQPLQDVSLIHFSNDWDDDAEDFIFILMESFEITPSLAPGEGLLIQRYSGLGTFPASGISFYDAEMNRHFFAVQHDNSNAPYWYFMRDITGQIRQ
ncbi:MAG: hypothetical protein FWC70_05760 [Defluviitaleaceae bacterium]|nr:hypothetical protein [Defluviitaleaceae bacterium]